MTDRGSVESYRDLEVWQRGIVLVERVYAVTDDFPDREQYELTSQLRRAVVAIPSNIAEGWGYRFARPVRVLLGAGTQLAA